MVDFMLRVVCHTPKKDQLSKKKKGYNRGSINSPNVLQLMNGSTNGGISMQGNTAWQQTGMKY